MKKHLLILFFSALFLLGNNSAFATHIVGGDITLVYVSPNTFAVSLTYFRDCSGVPYPATCTIGVYDKVNNTLQQTFVSNPASTVTLTLGDGCYTPVLCIQKRIYTATINLPDNPNGYYLAYGDQARNGVIINISNPGGTGYVFYVEVPDPALHNSSPSFTGNPDGYMCQNYLNTDEFTATDPNGDSLVYSLSDPLQTLTQGPPGPKPYGTVTWQAGYYTANPLGDPGMIVNPATGDISTLPPLMGTYVMAMKVEEYRAGVKLGEIRRDFQFEVTNCTLLNLSVSPGNPICLGTSATVSQTGAGAGFTYLWAPGGQTTSSIFVSPTSTGSYNYTLTATNGPCVKKSITTLVDNGNPTANVATLGNICAGQNNTLLASGGISYSWSNGSPLASIAVAPGTYTVWVTNSFNCSSTASGTITAPVASSYTWTGTGSAGANNWFDSNNWGNPSGCLPNCLTDIFIPDTPNDPDIGTGLGIAGCKDITLYANATLTFSNVNSELDVCGDFVDNGDIQTNSGQQGILKFTGTLAQTFSRTGSSIGGVTGNPFYSVIMANTGVPLPTVTLKNGANYKDLPISSTGSFSFQVGVPSVLITEGDRKLVINNTASAAISGQGPSNYVFGRIKRNLAVNTSYDFPVGNMPVVGSAYPYELMNLNFSALAGLTDVTVSFENPLLSNANGSGLPVNELSPTTGQYTALLDNGGNNTGLGAGGVGGLWTVIPSSYAAPATYSMTLKGKNYDNQGSFDHSILKRNTFCPATWSVGGAHLTSSVSGNVVTASRTGMVGFSQFVIAKTMTALPVELVLFDAACDKHHTELSWVTASETNNNYFTLERSCDENFYQYQTITTIPGSGSSSTMHTYSYVDNDDTPGDCYYRLSQTDFDNKTTQFAPIRINCSENAAFNFVGVLPNPAHDEVNVLFTSVTEDPVTIYVTDVAGKQLLSKEIQAQLGLNTVRISLQEFSSGIYFMGLNNGRKSFVKKIVKKD